LRRKGALLGGGLFGGGLLGRPLRAHLGGGKEEHSQGVLPSSLVLRDERRTILSGHEGDRRAGDL
jgi:hypothetical protein